MQRRCHGGTADQALHRACGLLRQLCVGAPRNILGGGGREGRARLSVCHGERTSAPLTQPSITQMNGNHTAWSAREALRSCRTALASFFRSRLEARRRRIEQDKEFYQKLAAYCRANNLSPICEDDWKTAAYSKDR